MNRQQRQYGRWCQKRLREKTALKNAECVSEILPPKTNLVEEKTQTTNSKKQNRSCFTDSNQANIQTIKSFMQSSTEKYPLTNLLQDQYGFDPALPENIVKEIQKVLGPPLKPLPAKIVVPMNPIEDIKQEKYCQYSDYNFKTSACVETSDYSLTRWRAVEKVEDVDNVLKEERDAFTEFSNSKLNRIIPKKIKISDNPKLKVVAKVFSKFTKNVIELRKLEEKIVCVEYDVTDEEDRLKKPLQKLRAFFRIIPVQKIVENEEENDIYQIPTKIRDACDIKNEDLTKLSEKEIEMIDDSVNENRPYLDSLKKLLKRNNEFYEQKVKDRVDLKTLYDMAKNSNPVFDMDSKSNLFSECAMNEMKELIIRNCVSSIQRINRKTIKEARTKPSDSNIVTSGVVSRSIVNELLRGIRN